MSAKVEEYPDLVWTLDMTRANSFERAEFPLPPDAFHHRALGEELLRLLHAEGPFISFGGSLVAVACLNPDRGTLAWSVAWSVKLRRHRDVLDAHGAYACIRVSMNRGNRFLVAAYAAERKRRRVKETISIPLPDRKRCEESAYIKYIAANLERWLLGAREEALRWRPVAVQLELPFDGPMSRPRAFPAEGRAP